MKDFDLRKYLAENKLVKELEVSDVNVKNDAENIMKEFIQAVEKASNSEEIFEKFENWVNSFMPGAIKEDLRKYLAENKLLKEEFVKGTPQYYVKYTTLDGKEVKSELMSKREAIYKERDLVDSGIKKSSVYKIQKNMDLNGKEYEIEYELDKDIEYRTDEKGKPIAENKLLKEDMSLTMDELEKLANLKSDEFKSSPKKLVDMVMGSVKFNLEKDGTNIENASEDEIDKLRYKWARLKGLLKVKDTFTSMYGKRGVKTNTDKDLLDKIK